MSELKRVKLAGESWFVDDRLQECRNVDNPNEVLSFDEFKALQFIEFNLKKVEA